MRRLREMLNGKSQNANARDAWKRFTGVFLMSLAGALALTVGITAQSQEQPQEKTAGQVFKNIQVLKDVPASQLIPGMRYITTALGARCDYCHDQNNFASDDKRPKQTARRMMTMLFAINKDNFDGRTEVSCFTCHQGHHEPMGVPPLPAEAVEPQFIRPQQGAASQPLPSVDDVLAKYAQAVGVEAAAKVQTREIQAQESMDGKTYAVDSYQKAPNQIYYTMTTPQGPMTAGFDGSQAWVAAMGGVEHLGGFEEIVMSRQAHIDPVATLKSYSAKRIRGQAKIGDATAYVMQATAPDGILEFLFFDEQSGLLVRRMIRDRTIFGALPVEADYADYRPVDGVNMPHKITWFTAGETSTITINDVKDNVPVDDSKFVPPQKQ